MRVEDLREEHLALYLHCLEPWSDEMKDAGPHKARWYARMKERGLGVKLAIDDDGAVAGMIQYVPAAEADVIADGAYVVLCIWVHGHRQGIGDRRGYGLGTALLAAAEDDVRARGATGLAAWGLCLPVWMRASWFRRHGYRRVDRDGLRALMFKAFAPGAPTPRWRRMRGEPPVGEDAVEVTSVLSGWCPVMNLAHERMARVVGREGDRVRLRVIDTTDPTTRAAWGVGDGLFVDGKPVRTGPPPSEAALAKIVARRLRARRLRAWLPFG